MSLGVNGIQETEKISEVYAPHLRDLDLERPEDHNNSLSFRPFAKLESHSLKNICTCLCYGRGIETKKDCRKQNVC